MKKGFYKRRPVDFTLYGVSHFYFNPISHWNSQGCGCGANALSTITGAPVRTFRKWGKVVKVKDGTAVALSEKDMVSILRGRGYTVIPLTICDLVPKAFTPMVNPQLTNDNVLLVSVRCFSDEASWFVLYKGLFAHNRTIGEISPLAFINKPILSVYLLYNPKWKKIPKWKLQQLQNTKSPLSAPAHSKTRRSSSRFSPVTSRRSS